MLEPENWAPAASHRDIGARSTHAETDWATHGTTSSTTPTTRTTRVRCVPDPVLVEVANRVAPVTVNDPDRRNAVTAEISSALRAAVDAAEADPNVHALIVTGPARRSARAPT